MKLFRAKVRLNICFKCRNAYELEKRSFAEYCRLCSEPMVAKVIREESIVSWARVNQEIVGKLMDEDKEKKKNELDEYYKNIQCHLNQAGQAQAGLAQALWCRDHGIYPSPYSSIFPGVG